MVKEEQKAEKKRTVIIGGVAGGASAATRLRRLDESMDIVVLERGPHVSFANCGLPYALGGEIADFGKLLLQTPEKLRAAFNLDVRVNSEAVAIHRDRREVDVRDAKGSSYSLAYDWLVLSPGAAPRVPPIPGINLPGQFTLRNIPDLERIDAWIKETGASRAVVVGGGYIGLEAAEQLHRRKLHVTVIEALPQVLAPFDPEMASPIHQELTSSGIDLKLGRGVSAFESASDAKASLVVLSDGTKIPADVVILGLGVKPEVELARAAGLTIGERGGIHVNEYLRTSDPNIFAVGDAVEVRDRVTGEQSLIALAGPANRMGRTVADNISGRAVAYPGTIGTAIVRVFKLTAACTGANEKTLKRLGRKYQAIHLHPNSHAGYYPGGKSIAMKVLFDPDSGKLLGAQAVGEDGVDKRIDVFATALAAGMLIDDAVDLELCYAPPFGSAKDPVNLAAMAAQNVRNGLVETMQWSEVDQAKRSDMVILDVREAGEREKGAIPDSIHIPLGKLRERLTELPRRKEILVHCQSGQRSYNACRILLQHGFRCRNLTGSYKTWSMGQAVSRAGNQIT